MYRGFSYYYNTGLKNSAKTLFGNKSLFAFLLYCLAEVLGRAVIIFNPLFSLANVRQGNLARKANKFGFCSSFREVGRLSSVATFILTILLEFLILLAGMVLIAILGAALGGMGYIVGKIADLNAAFAVFMFAIPCAPLALIFLIVALIIFSPTAYIIANNKNVTAGETIGACLATMRGNGKGAIFLTYFISILLKVTYLGAFSAIGYFIAVENLLGEYSTISLFVLIAVGTIGYIIFSPLLTLATRITKEHLFEDIACDPVTVARVCEKVNVSQCKGKKWAVSAPQNLASLFEYTEDPYKILSESEKKSQAIDGKPTRTGG